MNSIISNFKKIIKDYSIADKKLLLQSYKNKLNILTEIQQRPFATVCTDMNLSNIEHKLDKSKQVTQN